MVLPGFAPPGARSYTPAQSDCSRPLRVTGNPARPYYLNNDGSSWGFHHPHGAGLCLTLWVNL